MRDGRSVQALTSGAIGGPGLRTEKAGDERQRDRYRTQDRYHGRPALADRHWLIR
jgi:hypothetical protein